MVVGEGESSGSLIVVGTPVVGATVSRGVVGTGADVDVVAGALVVVGSAAAAGHDSVASAVSPHA